MAKAQDTPKKLVVRKTKKVAIFYRLATPAAIELAAQVTAWLKEKDFIVYTGPAQRAIPGTKLIKQKSILDELSLVVVLGGDGTYLRAARSLAGRPVPIVGVNMGSLGFLTRTRKEDLYTTIEQVLVNKMELRPRTMMKVEVKKAKGKTVEALALNDIVIERGSLSQLINLALYSEGKFVSDLKADGMIIATPTGSTAYNLAAGGPLLHPEVQAMVMTPIAPHSLTSRPMIFPDHCSLSFRLRSPEKGAKLVVDGQNLVEVDAEDEVRILRSPKNHYVVRHPDDDYFTLLRDKLKFGDRA